MPLIKLIHRIRKASGKDGADRFFSLRRHLFELFPVFGIRGLKDEGFDRFPVFRAADPYFEAWEIGTSDVVDYGLDAFVPSRTASLGNSNSGKREVEVVVHDEHSGGSDPEVLDDLSDCFAASVHVSERFYKKDFSPLGDSEPPGGTELTLHHCGRVASNKPVNYLKPHIVACVLVFFPRIAKADQGKNFLFVAADITHRSVNSEQ